MTAGPIFTSLSLCVSFSRKCLRNSTGSSTIQFQMTFSATSLTDTPSPPTSPSASRWMMGRTAAQIQDGKNVWACCMWWRCSARSSSPVPKQQSHNGLHQKGMYGYFVGYFGVLRRAIKRSMSDKILIHIHEVYGKEGGGLDENCLVCEFSFLSGIELLISSHTIFIFHLPVFCHHGNEEILTSKILKFPTSSPYHL